MRNPHRWRTIDLAFFASGIVAAPLPFVLPEAAAGDTARGILFVYGVMAFLFGGCAALIHDAAARAWDSLRRGEDVVARWHVDSATWRAFLALNHRINQEHSLSNELTLHLRKEIPADGIDVIVSRTGVEIDGDFHHLPPRGVPHIERAELMRGDPSYIDLALWYPGGGRGASGLPRLPRRTALRFPAGAGAHHEALRALALYNGDLPGKPDFFHGRGDGSNPEDLSKCFSCGYGTHKYVRTCPRCGTGMQSRRWSRRFGWGLFVCGLLITGTIGAVLYYTAPMLLRPGIDVGGTRFSGSSGQALLVLGILTVAFTFGATALAYGVWQIKTGRRSKNVIYFTVGLFTVLAFIAVLI